MPMPQQSGPGSSQSQSSPPGGSNQSSASAAAGKSNSSKMAITIGALAVVLVMAIGGVVLAYGKGKQTVSNSSGHAASAPSGPNAFYTNRLTLETPTSIVELTEVRQKDAKRCVETFYHCIQKRTQQAISLTGYDSYAMDANGELGDFLGWTFKNGDYTYSVTVDGRLVVTQGKKKLLTEDGTWTEQNYQLRPPDR